MRDMILTFWNKNRFKKRAGRLAITMLLLIPVCLAGSQACTDDNESKPPDLRHQIARMLMVGVRGTGPELNEEMTHLVTTLGVGGIILYEYDAVAHSRPRNISSREQVTKLVTNLRQASVTPLLVGIDQEGGRVNRLKPVYGYPPTVTAQYLGTLDNPDTTAFYASRIAEMVSLTGINLNFAPVVDLNTNPECPVIGQLGRSFSADPDVVTKIAAIFYEKQQQADILTTYKHFPGHGSAAGDSHAGFTDITETWQPIELKPYSRLIQSGKCDLIMTAHVYNAHLDSVYPATLSKYVIQHILRDSLKFNGVIVSDDMMMGAITQSWDLETAIFKAIDAGVDILIFSNNVTEYNPQIALQAIDLIEKMVKDGRISPTRIALSYDRIAKLHRRLN
ncbi:MAG TPA: glycoside hydrolase family 3 [Bacteroidales bacterium]|nr:glycoside hydrolase family 3 [Bacteroidales bacterium]HBZ67279.1 glycoside hydrolase family 3 [Bacteroidales bacterium]